MKTMNLRLHNNSELSPMKVLPSPPREGLPRSSSVHDSAALLLSIADIAKSEIGTSGSKALWNEGIRKSVKQHPLLLPPFPILQSDEVDNSAELPCSSKPKRQRVRSVSMDVHDWSKVKKRKANSPLISDTPRRRKLNLRPSTKTKKDYFSDSSDISAPSSPRPRALSLDAISKKGKPLQGNPPKGVVAQMIHRKKFSWKNYPELEQFLITNREDYLNHSALNYTVQQKQYNNRLTENLLELATSHGYIFDTADFGFVTVRDRIRCYFKSYVQSAKKRGILMGYAARKAGLLDTKDLQEQTNGEIASA